MIADSQDLALRTNLEFFYRLCATIDSEKAALSARLATENSQNLERYGRLLHATWFGIFCNHLLRSLYVTGVIFQWQHAKASEDVTGIIYCDDTATVSQ